MTCSVCNGTGVVNKRIASSIVDEVPCNACRVSHPMTSPIVDDYIKHLKRIRTVTTFASRIENANVARRCLSVMNAKAAEEATQRVATEGLQREEGYLFGQPLAK